MAIERTPQRFFVNPVAVPPWIAIALGEIGVLEDTRPGKSNPRIEQYHSVTAAGRAVDDVAWCASFVGYCLEAAGVRSTRNKAASSYLAYGDRLAAFRFGCVCVFGKADVDAKGTGHVFFGLGVSSDVIYGVGGNQGDRVSIATRKLSTLEAMVYPAAVQLPSMPP